MALMLTCAAAAPLTGCSSGDEPAPRPDTDLTTPTTQDGQETETEQQKQEREKQEREKREREKNDGSFSRAGRLSDGFSGHWPQSYKKTVTNPSSGPYVGTLEVLDCTPGETSRAAIPPSRTVSLPPGGTAAPEFKFSKEGGNSKPTRQVCATLRNAAGVSDEVSEPISADPVTPPGQTGDTTTDNTTGQTGDTTTDNTTGQTGDTTTDNTTGQTGDTTTDNTTGQTGDTTTDNTTGQTGDTTTGDTTGGTSETGGSDGNG
ncbi:hypothetical protein [Streptomyces sp. NK15101]|uniref:hypothetical protein n=1 Tax=Streptomyces sp. NK15101 TaxID=2873261 RepID=UPI001CEC8C71|nr:hypothetical protein [Streptomyces sp. NK15101]